MWPFSSNLKTYKLTPTQELLLALLRAQLWLKPVDDIVLPGCGKGIELSEAVSQNLAERFHGQDVCCQNGANDESKTVPFKYSQSEGCEYSGMTGNKNDTDEDVLQQWNGLMDLGYRQTVICFIAAACLRHKDVDKIPLDIREEMEAVIEENKKIHEYHNKTIVEVFTLLEDNGLHPILLKGQGLAQLYDCVGESCKEQEMPSLEIEHCPLSVEHSQNSVLRQCGDIDIFIGPKDYEKACRIMDDYCGPEAKENAFYEDQLHYHISNGVVTFEIHRKAADAAKTYKDKQFNAWALEWLVWDKCLSTIINDKKIFVPGPQYNILYVFDHLIKHVKNEGVNLRQFCDWMMVSNCNVKTVDQGQLYEDLKIYSSLKAWQILGGILVKKLGLNKESFPYWNQNKSVKSQGGVFDEIINGGSFCVSTKLNDTHTNQKRGIKRTIDAICIDYKISRFVAVISLKTAMIYFFDQLSNRLVTNLRCFNKK